VPCSCGPLLLRRGGRTLGRGKQAVGEVVPCIGLLGTSQVLYTRTPVRSSILLFVMHYLVQGCMCAATGRVKRA